MLESKKISTKTNGLIDMRITGSYPQTTLKLFQSLIEAPPRSIKMDDDEFNWIKNASMEGIT